MCGRKPMDQNGQQPPAASNLGFGQRLRDEVEGGQYSQAHSTTRRRSCQVQRATSYHFLRLAATQDIRMPIRLLHSVVLIVRRVERIIQGTPELGIHSQKAKVFWFSGKIQVTGRKEWVNCKSDGQNLDVFSPLVAKFRHNAATTNGFASSVILILGAMNPRPVSLTRFRRH